MTKRVSVIGLWHLGIVSAAGLADMGFDVIAYDPDKKRIADLRRGIPPLYEPGLEELVKRHLAAGRLRFEENFKNAVSEADTILLTYDTPVDEDDHPNLLLLDQTIEELAPVIKSGALLIIHSQIPLGTSERWQGEIEKMRRGAGIDLITSPENLRLGQAIELFKNPDMIVIGSGSDSAKMKAESFYGGFKSEKFFVSWRTAEMAKHALNVFFATSISFANELGLLCDRVGADGIEIAHILKKDSRIGKKAQVRPGLGFAGGTLARDLRALQKIGERSGVPTPLVNSVFEINRRQISRVVEILEEYFEGELSGKTVTLFGLTYKPGTSTLRRSASLEIIDCLQGKGVHVKAHDPKADLSELKQINFEFSRDPYEAAKNADALVLLTEWPEYRELDFSRVKKNMKQPVILDTKNHLDGNSLKKLMFEYYEIGRGQLAKLKAVKK